MVLGVSAAAPGWSGRFHVRGRVVVAAHLGGGALDSRDAFGGAQDMGIGRMRRPVNIRSAPPAWMDFFHH
jgi:hypothetical protein